MTRSVRSWGVAAALVIAGGVAALAAPEPHGRGAPDRVFDESAAREQDIAFFRRRIARDPHGAADRGRLAALYLERARETGSAEDLARAEQVARESLARRSARNETTRFVLASSLLAQHRFDEALAEARAYAAAEPADPGRRSLVAEILLELGRYEEARTSFRGLRAERRNPVVAARLARWAEIEGRTGEAHRLLLEARRRANGLHGLSGAQRAWFDLRVGDLALRNGRLREADEAFRAGLAANPGDARVLSAMARLEMARGRWRRAVEHGEAAVAVSLDPGTLGLLGDAWTALGDGAQAEQFYHAAEVAAGGETGAPHRAWSLALLDRGRRGEEVLAQARADVRARPDVYGYDLLAWALHRTGRSDEALAAMDRALALGTRDASLFYHASEIRRARGDTGAAREYLERALEVDPHHAPALRAGGRPAGAFLARIFAPRG